MNPVTIRDIVQVADWKEVVRARNYYYPSDKKNDYVPIFEYLKTVKFKKPSQVEKIRIVIGGFQDKILDKDRDERGQFYSIGTNLYSMSFRKWADLANIPIDEQTLQCFKIEEILAHFLWEITFYGTEKDAAKISKSIQRRVKEFKKDPKKYTEK